METKEKVKLAFACFAAAAISILAASHYVIRRRRHQNASSSSSSSFRCYLETSEERKPQTAFKRVLADNSYTPFKHLVRNQEKSADLHPYIEEITALMNSPLKIENFNFTSGVGDVVDFDMKGSHVWVDTEDQLVKLVEVLSKETVFAVDTEQHSLHSFLGFTSLIQISTQEEDYLVDTIALHDVISLLRPVFEDSNICKVFHGADNDVTWLQRDFHIYVVNMFDTAKACEVLSKPHKSLAYLLETYCAVATNKVFQREDWRLRPLSGEMVEYARADAHYLLYIANCLVTELKRHGTDCLDDKFPFVVEASRRSNMMCLQLYTKEIGASAGDSAASSILSRYLSGEGGVPLKCETKELVGRLCLWRDLMARVHDESLRYVLSDQAIFALASKVPTTASETYDTISETDLNLDSLGVGSSMLSPSAVVNSHLKDLYDLLWEKISNQDEIFERILQKHLGPNGSCPLSVYNYVLLSKSNLKLTNGFLTKHNGSKAAKRASRKVSREQFVQKFSCKAPVYHNGRIYASDSRLLCYCDRRKLEWYLHRGLAKLVDDDPLAIMLLFEPKGRPEDEDNDFYVQSKRNICVGCGEKNHYLPYRVIPSCYRVHFPEHLKSHRSHDIVLLCVDCHEIAHSAAEKYKRQIAKEFGIPLFVQKVSDSSQTKIKVGTSVSLESTEEAGVSPSQLRTAAFALLRHGPNLPIERREELTQIVRNYFGGRKVSEKDLEKALLVGMSPRDKRRLEKKKGIFLKHSSGVLSNKNNENSADCMNTSDLTETLEGDNLNKLQIAKGTKEGQNISLEINTGEKYAAVCSELGVIDKSSATGSGDLNFVRMKISEMENILGSNEESYGRMSEGVSNSSCGPNVLSRKSLKKFSLLGHGPHGEQVVDHLLKEYGEEGVRQFCQRWRQVFVEAIHPRFLPAGWDVLHRGRREFGEYSVFNPTKKATTGLFQSM